MSTDPPEFESERYFDRERAAQYDEKIKKIIPGYETLHEMVFHVLDQTLRKKANLLIVGVGTGKEVTGLAKAHPSWHFTATDISEDMLTTCRQRIEEAGVSKRVDLHAGEIGSIPKAAAFDAATAILVSHFINGRKQKLAFFKSIAQRCKPKAPFITVELCADPSEQTFKNALKWWQGLYASKDVSEEQIKKDFDHIRTEIGFISETGLRGLLEEAGFKVEQPFYRAYLLHGLVCYKK